MFNAVIHSRKINRILDTIGTVVEECQIELSEDGLSSSAADEAGVCVVDISISNSAFESFESREQKIGVDVAELSDILSIADDEPISLILENHHLQGIFDEVDYHSALIDLDHIENKQEIPDLDLRAQFGLTASQLNKAIKVTSQVSDKVVVVLDEEGGEVIFNASGDDNRVNVEYEKDELIHMNDSGAEAMFSLGYLEKINSVIPEDGEIDVRFGEDFPMVMDYEILDGDGEVSIMLAPRLDENQDPY